MRIDDVVVGPVTHALWDGGELWFEFPIRPGVVLSVVASECDLWIEVEIVEVDGACTSAWVSHGLLRPIGDDVVTDEGPVGPVEVRCRSAVEFREAAHHLREYPVGWPIVGPVDAMLCPISTAEELLGDRAWVELPHAGLEPLG